MLCQLEVSDEVVLAAAEKASFFALNAAPARVLDLEPDLLVVNRLEYEVVKRGKLVAVTDGANGAVLYENGRQIAGSASPEIIPVDGTGAGDAFTAALVVSLLDGAAVRGLAATSVHRGRLRRRDARRAELAADRERARGLAEADLMAPPIIIDCDPGHDDAIALMLAVASPELELLGVTTVAGNQTLEKTTANALRVLELTGRADVRSPRAPPSRSSASGTVAAHVHGETGLDGPDLPPPSRQRRSTSTRSTSWRGTIREREGALTLVPIGPLTNIALLLALAPDARPERIVLMGGSVGEGNRTPAAEFNIWADPEAARRVFESGIDVTMIGLDVTHKALLTEADADTLRGSGRVGKVAAELLDFYAASTARTTPTSPARRSTTRSPSRT